MLGLCPYNLQAVCPIYIRVQGTSHPKSGSPENLGRTECTNLMMQYQQIGNANLIIMMLLPFNDHLGFSCWLFDDDLDLFSF
jgi:hypothetical protein